MLEGSISYLNSFLEFLLRLIFLPNGVSDPANHAIWRRLLVYPRDFGLPFFRSHGHNNFFWRSGRVLTDELTICEQSIHYYFLKMTEQPSHVLLQTTQGTITLELYWNHAPMTCKNFAQLATRGYYNGTPFHRMWAFINGIQGCSSAHTRCSLRIPDFMIQGGDPTGTGRGGTSIYGDKVRRLRTILTIKWFTDLLSQLFLSSSRMKSHRSLDLLALVYWQWPTVDQTQTEANLWVSLLRSSRDRSWVFSLSLFYQFITLAPTPFLDRKHTIFGRVSDGMNIVQRMSLVAVDTNDRWVLF